MSKQNKNSKRIVIRVSDEQHKALTAIAKMTGLTLSNYVRKRLDLPAERKGERKDLKLR